MTYHKSDDSNSSEDGARRRHRARGLRGRRDHNRRHSGHGDRKERVLHTRISEQLSEDIRRFAEDLRVPASNLVRNVLEEVFTVVDGVSDDVSDLFDDLLEEAEGVRERVRRQSRPRSRSRSGSRRRSSTVDRDRDVDVADDADVEAELRQDEATEASPGMGASQSAASDTSDTSDTSDASDTSERPARSGAESGSDPERPAANELFPDVLGWQPLVLNRDFACGRCRRSLRAGESAFLGLAASGLTEIALCGRCAGRR
jgi:hypothetical protein